MNDAKGIASRIKARRLELGLTPEDFAKKCNASRASVFRWEAGALPERKMIEVCAALECSTSWLLTGEEGSEETQRAQSSTLLKIANRHLNAGFQSLLALTKDVEKLKLKPNEIALLRKTLDGTFAEFATFAVMYISAVRISNSKSSLAPELLKLLEERAEASVKDRP